MSDYVPIDCSVHDRFEAAATRRETVAITWYSSGAPVVTRGRIDDIRVQDGAEYLVIGTDLIRLDWIEGFDIDG